MKLDISIINVSYFQSKKNSKYYTLINYILVGKESLIDSDNFKGYSIANSFVEGKNLLKDIPIGNVSAEFDEFRSGLRSSLKLKAISHNGKVIDLV